MNERIQESAAKAGFYVADGKIYIPTTSEDITKCQEKFAELIVRECMSKAAQGQLTNMNGNQIAYIIKEHFGV